MSQNVFTKNGWVQTSGNVNPQLIDDVNQRIDGYVDGGYLPIKNYASLTLGTQTKNGLTITKKDNGTYVINGTATASTLLDFATNIPLSGTYKVLGCPSGGSASKYYVTVQKDGSWFGSDTGNGFELTVDSIVNRFLVSIASGTVMNNVVFKPLITDNLNLTYSTYDYAPSNVELQSEIDATPTEYTITPSDKVTSSSYFKLLVKGKFAQLIADVTYTTNATAYTVDLLGTLPSNIKPFGTTNLNFMGTYNLTDTALKSIIINPNNKTISAQCGQTNQSKRLFINITFLLE